MWNFKFRSRQERRYSIPWYIKFLWRWQDSLIVYYYYYIIKLILWKRRPNKHKLTILRYVYNGFSGELIGGQACFLGEFIKWTSDPGVAVIKCSDNKTRTIPSFAIEGHLPPTPNYHRMKKKNKMTYFGHPSKS